MVTLLERFESLQKQFICRIENLARTKRSLVHISDNESTSSDTSSFTSGGSQKRSVDEYGCKNYQALKYPEAEILDSLKNKQDWLKDMAIG